MLQSLCAGGDERLRFGAELARGLLVKALRSQAESPVSERRNMRFSALFDKHEAVRPVAPEGEVLALELVEIVGRQFELRRGAVNSASRDQNWRAARRRATLSEPSDGAER